jgi:hypothetical protein
MRLPALPIFVATRRADVPAACRRYLSVDGSVPGAALTWDHHVTGEPVNLGAMPARLDPAAFDGVGTTLADTDALASVVAVLFGGADALPPRARDALLAASWFCDHLVPHPALSPAANRTGRRLDRYVSAALARRATAPGSEFARLCRLVARRIADGRPLPGRAGAPSAATLRALATSGRLRLVGDLLLADLRGLPPGAAPPPLAVYRWRPAARLAVLVGDHRSGGPRYTVGRNPLSSRAPTDLTPLLAALAAAEFAHGPPALRPEARPGAENWGGRREVGGSPWNYGSRLSVDDVLATARAWLG